MTNCELPLNNPTSEEIRLILLSVKTIAIVGLSDKVERPSYHVALYLKEQGYKIVPVNPNIKEVLGEKAYARLEDVPYKIDVVDIFRKSQEVPEIVDSSIKISAKIIWMQEGVVHNLAAQKAKENGLRVVMNKCIMKEHKKVIGTNLK